MQHNSSRFTNNEQINEIYSLFANHLLTESILLCQLTLLIANSFSDWLQSYRFLSDGFWINSPTPAGVQTFLPVIKIIDIINYLLTLLLAPFAECIQPGQCKHCQCKRTIPSKLPTILVQRWGGWQEGKLEIKASPWRTLFPPREGQECLPDPGAEHSLPWNMRSHAHGSDLLSHRLHTDYTSLSLGFRPRF